MQITNINRVRARKDLAKMCENLEGGKLAELLVKLIEQMDKNDWSKKHDTKSKAHTGCMGVQR